jgi:uncharacterized coiled-coil protein SlyX
MEADRKTNREELKQEIRAFQEQIREEIKSGQAEMISTVSAIKEKLEAAIHSLRACQNERMACQDDDGGTSGMQGANLSGHEGLPR